MLPAQSLTCWLIFFPKPRPYLSLLASLISASSFPWAQRNASSSVSWLMITTWPLAVHCTIPQSLMDSSVPFSCPSVGLLVSLDIQLLFFLISTTLRWSQYHWSHSLWCGPTNCIVQCSYTHHWACFSFCELSYPHSHHVVHPRVIYPGAQIVLQDPSSAGQQKPSLPVDST